TGRQLVSMPHGWPQFSRDDTRLWYRNGPQLGLLEVAISRECRTLQTHGTGPAGTAPAFGWGGRLLASVAPDVVHFWDVQTGIESAFLKEAGFSTLKFHSRTGDLFTVGRAGLHRWPVTPLVIPLSGSSGVPEVRLPAARPMGLRIGPPV